jgi:hypothetical protein
MIGNPFQTPVYRNQRRRHSRWSLRTLVLVGLALFLTAITLAQYYFANSLYASIDAHQAHQEQMESQDLRTGGSGGKDGSTRSSHSDFIHFDKAEPMKMVENTRKIEHYRDKVETSPDFSSMGTISLPNFAFDFSEYAVGGLIERESDSFELHIATFFVCHDVWKPKGGGLTRKGGLKILKGSEDTWKYAFRKMENTEYHNNGMRRQKAEYYCRIQNVDTGGRDANHDLHRYQYPEYTVPGQFVPNRLTIDSNSNKRLDIFRCKLEDGENAYRSLARHSTAQLRVDIVRRAEEGEKGREDEPVLSYHIPWATRMVGLATNHPAPHTPRSGVVEEEVHLSPKEKVIEAQEQFKNPWGVLDAWKGYDADRPGHWTHDRIYMCVPGVESPPSKKSLPLLLEFVAHHLLLGVDHMFLALSFDWHSPHMLTLKRMLQSKIDSSHVSIASSCSDGIDMAVSTSGILWGRDNVKTFQTNMCSYFAKGMADYVGVWDIDEFFIPTGDKVHTLPELLDTLMPAQKDVMFPDKNDYFQPLRKAAADAALLSMGSTAGAGGGASLQLQAMELNTSTLFDMYEQWPTVRDSLRAQGVLGLAEGNWHPACYLLLKSAVTLQHSTTSMPGAVSSSPFLGQRFAHGHEPLGAGHGLGFTKTIRPTRTVYSSSLHVGGACRLPPPWNGCSPDPTHHTNQQQGGEGVGKGGSKYCHNPHKGGTGRTVVKSSHGLKTEFSARHYFDEVTIGDNDALAVPPDNGGYINHIQFHRYWHSASPEARAQKSDYSVRFFPAVFAELDRMGLALPLLLPGVSEPDPNARQGDERGRMTPDVVSHEAFLQYSSPRVPHTEVSSPRWAKEANHDDTAAHSGSSSSEEEGSMAQSNSLNLCIADLYHAPVQSTMGEVLEAVQHHLLLGVKRVFLCVHFEWGSVSMRRYQRALDDYIHEGRVVLHACSATHGTVTAAHQPGRNLASTTNTVGKEVGEEDRDHDETVQWKRRYARVCAALSTAADSTQHDEHSDVSANPWRAQYLGVWGLDQFLSIEEEQAPGPYSPSSIRRLLEAVVSSSKKGKNGVCAAAIATAVVPALHPTFSFQPESANLQWWVGEQFRHRAVDASTPLHQLYATDPALIVTLDSNAGGGDNKWVLSIGISPDAAQSCAQELPLEGTGGVRALALRFMTGRLYHKDPSDKPTLKIMTGGTIQTNRYSDVYFSVVHRELRRRRLDLLVDLRATVPILDHATATSSSGLLPKGVEWLDYDGVWEGREK